MENRKIYNSYNIRTENDLLQYFVACFIGYFTLDEIDKILGYIKREIL